MAEKAILMVRHLGGVCAIEFASVDAARRWEDGHRDDIDSLGIAPIVNRRDVLRAVQATTKGDES